jgi:hypothetical protein
MKPPPLTTQSFDWAQLTRLVHPMQVAVVEALLWIGRPLSAKDFSQMFAEQIGGVNTTSYMSYHVRELAKIDVIEPAGTESVRGAMRKFYVLSSETSPCP